ncbi:universal stress protein [Knoellia sp. CPCC 206435]|uniref:universal stress protein n=1 Tax=Knoellia terrae TaxID=3404797 RepID=UPI003B42A7B7
MGTPGAEAQGAVVVVGVDGGQPAGRAVEEAAAQAMRCGRPLHLMHATGRTFVPWTPAHLQRVAVVTAHCRHRAAKVSPDLRITTATEVDDPAAMLVAASQHSSMVVLDGGRLGRDGAVLLGATAHTVVAHASCPVMVVPLTADWSTTGPVVVGVDTHEHSAPAVELAFAEASRRGAPLRAVHTWWSDEADASLAAACGRADRSQVVESHRRTVAEMLARWRHDSPDVDVTLSLARGRAGTALVRESRTAQLLVVGRRGLGGFPGLLLGSVGSHVIRHAPCPVIVVPSSPTGGSDGLLSRRPAVRGRPRHPAPTGAGP